MDTESSFIMGFSVNRATAIFGREQPDAVTFQIRDKAFIYSKMYETTEKLVSGPLMALTKWSTIRVTIDKNHIVAFQDGKRLLSHSFSKPPFVGKCHIGVFGNLNNVYPGKTEVKRMDIIRKEL